jgi:hypothetical protein
MRIKLVGVYIDAVVDCRHVVEVESWLSLGVRDTYVGLLAGMDKQLLVVGGKDAMQRMDSGRFY